MQDKEPHPPTTRIYTGDRISAPENPERLEARAQQIAGSDGRSPSEVTEKDRVRAWRELRDEGGTGVPDRDAVEARARQIAVIEGRHPEECTDADRVRAWKELHDVDLERPDAEPRAQRTRSRDPGDIPVQTGHREPRQKAPDEATLPEIEAKEGVREAEHERMLRGNLEGPDEART